MDRTDICKYHYLILDDDLVTANLIVSLLRRQGVSRVDVAGSGKIALGQIKATRAFPDIVISDLNMPDMDGVEFMQYLADEHFTGGIVLVSGSAKNMLSAVRRLGQARFLNVLGTLPKPFTAEELLAFVMQYADSRRASTG